MTLPSFLIIGAMKAGTTSLFRDLRAHSGIFIPGDKELHTLNTDEVLSEAGRAAYAEYFAPARPGAICGEASTGYTKLPDITGVPARAAAVLGDDIRLIYLVRHPIARMISHYHHTATVGGLTMPIDEAFRSFPLLLDYSRYDMQIDPWVEQFGADSLKVVVFEEYIKDRTETVERLCGFLGAAREADHVDADRVYNKGAGRPVQRGPAAAFSQTGVYRRLVRPLLPLSARDALHRWFLPRAKKPSRPSAESVAWAVEQLTPDVERFAARIGRDLPWDLSTAVADFAAPEA